ncbi:MAG: hypothetical protein HY721_03140 [Planctomycetes bacterium]|nr:hypothetical protein [Planctomycetota bacterium]
MPTLPALPTPHARRLFLVHCGFIAAALLAPLRAQTPKLTPPAGAPAPAVAYEGLVAGESTLEEVKAKLGKPEHEASWYAWKLTYASKTRPGHFDAIHIQGERRVGDIEAATVPPGFETWAAVREKLGEPEWLLDLSRQSLADYSARGARFVFDSAGRTIGVASFPRGFPRVHAGERKHVSLRGLRQGPQPRPAAAPPQAAGAEPLLAGAAEAEITPRGPDWLGPVKFTVHDPLKVRAAVFAQGPLKVAFVGGDIFGMRKVDIDPIEARLREAGISHVLLALSHVHSAGDPIGIYGHYPEEYVKRIQDGVTEAATAALVALEPVSELRVASDELPLDGARVEGLFRNARNPGIVDPQVAAVQAIGDDSKPIVTIAHFACHPEGIEAPKGKPLEVSADFPGYLCDALRAATGAQAVFLNGALGGMVSGDTRARTHDEAEAMGKRLAKEVERVLGFAVPTERRLSFERSRLEIPVTNPRMIAFEMSTGQTSSYRGRHLTEMFHARLGEAELLSVPGELLPEVSFEILERMRGYPRMIVGLANDEIGYIIPAYDFRAGDYEESMSLGPAASLLVLRQALRFLER